MLLQVRQQLGQWTNYGTGATTANGSLTANGQVTLQPTGGSNGVTVVTGGSNYLTLDGLTTPPSSSSSLCLDSSNDVVECPPSAST